MPIIGFYILFKEKSPVWFFSGFFVGLFWFYWIGFSFIYYGFAYLFPVACLFIALGYGFIFLLPSLVVKNTWIRAFLLVAFVSFLPPFGFNWLDFRLLLLNTPFGLDYISLFAFIFFVLCLSTLKGYKKLFAVVFLLFSLNTKVDLAKNQLPFSISLINSQIPQEDKWKKELTSQFVRENIQKINQAIKEKKEIIIFPESAFTLFLNRIPKLMDMLEKKSQKITIITGALTYENKKFYNSTYVFADGKTSIFHKVILVPFGEEIPMPNFLKKWINEIFYEGAEDFSTAKNPQDYQIKGINIRNAICFEATTSLLYKNKPKFMIAMSNNAWFTPSFEPLIQHLLLLLNANLNHTTIYHSVNGSKSEIIYPKQNPILFDFLKEFDILHARTDF